MESRIAVCLVATFLCFAVIEKLISFVVESTIDERPSESIILEGRGQIKPGHYFYTTVNDKGQIDISLEPKIGDVDLYISVKQYPTYKLNNHDISSYSCGSEDVSLGKDYQRPFYVGVYCYDIYDNCTFFLTISSRQSFSGYPIYQDSEVNERAAAKKHYDNKPHEKHLKSTFLTLVEIIFESFASVIM